MPSLHIGTAAWIFFAFRGQRSKLAPLAGLFAIYLWAMSVALGWHYAIDGIVGAGGAFVCQRGSRAWVNRRQREVETKLSGIVAA